VRHTSQERRLRDQGHRVAGGGRKNLRLLDPACCRAAGAYSWTSAGLPSTLHFPGGQAGRGLVSRFELFDLVAAIQCLVDAQRDGEVVVDLQCAVLADGRWCMGRVIIIAMRGGSDVSERCAS
jgi:hypothetical protein